MTTACVRPTINATFVAANGAIPAEAQTTAAQSTTRIDVNHADARELERLPGIGATLAARIIEHRARYGKFRRAENLLLVRGMSEKKFLALQSLITANA